MGWLAVWASFFPRPWLAHTSDRKGPPGLVGSSDHWDKQRRRVPSVLSIPPRGGGPPDLFPWHGGIWDWAVLQLVLSQAGPYESSPCVT